MAQREKFCVYCNKYFFYEETSPSDCPTCIDPHAIPYETYEKRTIISRFKMHLKDNGVQIELFDEDSVLSMLKDFPKANILFNSNGTYRTITLYTGTKFDGKHGKYKLGPVVERYAAHENRKPKYIYFREVICLRCLNSATTDNQSVLDFFLGFQDKNCIKCDSVYYIGSHPRNTNGLNRNGSTKSDTSERAIAQSLNVSLNDLRRHGITQREEALPDGTVINGLQIVRAFWDDSTYSPRYELVCPKCQNRFTILQKRVHLLSHPCKVVVQS